MNDETIQGRWMAVIYDRQVVCVLRLPISGPRLMAVMKVWPDGHVEMHASLDSVAGRVSGE